MIREFSDEIKFQTLTSRQSYVPDFHLHNFYEIFILLEGEVKFCIHDSFYHITPGTLLVINDLEIHKLTNLKDTPYKRAYIHVPPSFFDKYSSEDINLAACFTAHNPGNHNAIKLNHKDFDYIMAQYAHMDKAFKSSFAGSKLLLETHLLQLLIYINNISTKKADTTSIEYTPEVQKIIKYLDEHILDNITLDDLSLQFSLSKYYLCHVFKKETGTTIFNYLLLRRIARAKSLLSDGMNVTEACFQSGFRNYSNFITSFKKITGYTPKKYSGISRT